ncbi:hypothetical protein BC777_3469 [Yoonia maricola]|uniref:Uncharacterized protein n=1 Tax=Yoonia maricola TaxID=420999 RepID=A0A2M8W0G6_9RHOB|nr:hypothetical protein [Yoonia maricola]PJI84411.1 hypothetical protein BC777_3469 [Yoonia maricola]
MQRPQDATPMPPRDSHLNVPSKDEVLRVLQQDDSSRAGLQLEWMLDRCNMRERGV